MFKRISMVGMIVVFAALNGLALGATSEPGGSGEQLKPPALSGTTKRNPLSYQKGDEIVFTLAAVGGKSVRWTRTGGDGTILRAVRRFPDVPVLGFNLGSLGYLASVGEGDFPRALAMLASGRFSVSERTMLEVGGFTALNDIVIMREMTGHAAVLDLAANGSSATRYMADGIVVATPTGSTAYSLSAGGPVLMPDSRSFVVTPMNPHALGVRPMVVSDSVRLRITSRRYLSGTDERLGVYADGENVKMLGAGETVEIAKSARAAKLVELDGYDPYEVLNRKLGWSK